MNKVVNQHILRMMAVVLLALSAPGFADTDSMSKTNSIANSHGKQTQLKHYRACLRSEINQGKDSSDGKAKGHSNRPQQACSAEAEAHIADLPNDIPMISLSVEQQVLDQELSKREQQHACRDERLANRKMEADYPRSNETVKRNSATLFSCFLKERRLA